MPFLIDDDSTGKLVPDDRETGLLARDYDQVEYGSLEFASEISLPLIPMEEWPDRIADQERERSSLKHVWKEGLKGLIWDQDGYPFCHGFSAVMTVMLARCARNLPTLPLSASSIGAPAAGWRKRGAWIIDDLRRLVSHGACTTEFFPMLEHRRSEWTQEAEENAALHKVEEWWELGRKNFQHTGTALLAAYPIADGRNYWSHATVTGWLIDKYPSKPATDWRRYAVGCINSWGYNWGDQGEFELHGNKALCDEQYCPLVTTSSTE